MQPQNLPQTDLTPPAMNSRIILATNNQGKVAELQKTLASFLWTIESMGAHNLESPPETGSTFLENALIKARHASQVTGLWTFADDSGLEVDSLNGAPGVDTADYGGWEKLLGAMKDTPPEQRGARFVCCLVLCAPSGEYQAFYGYCRGHIAPEGRGTKGFAFDPVFIPEGQSLTFAEMTSEAKQGFSHRGKALENLRNWITSHNE